MNDFNAKGKVTNTPRLSFGAKTLILEVTDADKMSRRQFLKKSLVFVGGAAVFAISLSESSHGQAEAADCSCHRGCYTNCHSDCGRKTW